MSWARRCTPSWISAPWAVVLGDEEALAGQLRLKPLRGEGEEQQLSWEDALSYLTKQR